MKKFVHLGDLHLGVKFHKRNLIEDQKYALDQVGDWIVNNNANLIVAGDVFDTVNPPIDAQELWFSFLLKITRSGSEVFVIPGNHDSAARLCLGSDFFETENIHILRQDELYRVFEIGNGWRLFCVPFLKPSLLEMKRSILEEEYDAAYSEVIKELDERYKIDDKTILVAHQTFEGGKTGESEFKPFMSDAIAGETVSRFHQVITGHLHSRQTLGNIYYCGSLLPYAFGDDYYEGFSVWEIPIDEGESGDIKLETEPLSLLHKLVSVEGILSTCLGVEAPNDYVKVKLQNVVHFEEALSLLQDHFPLLCCVASDASEEWEADLNKELKAFSTVQEAIDAFCDHLEIPHFEGIKKQKIQEALDAFTESKN